MTGQIDSITRAIHDALEKQLGQTNLDLVDVIPIPIHSDRMVRLRTLEEALADFERMNANGNAGEDTAGESIGYLIQLKPARPKPAPEPEQPAKPQKQNLDGIYRQDGKLNVEYLIQNAELLFNAGDYVLSRNIYRTIIQAGERTSVGLFGLARCFEAEGKLDEARSHYEESIAYHGTLEAYHRLAALLIKQEKDRNAAEVFGRALHLKELSLEQRFELHKAAGNCWTRVNAIEQAQAHYQRAIELVPTADEIRANLGALFLQNKKIPEAKRHFQDAVAANPRNDKALFGLASCLLAEGDKRGAHDTFARSLEANIHNPTAIFHLVKLAYEIRSYVTAARVIEEYVEVAPVNANLLYSLAGLQFHLGRTAEARSTAQRILQLSADHSGAKELLGMIGP